MRAPCDISTTSIGIDIGGSSVKAAGLCDGQVAWTRRSSTYQKPDAAQLAAAIREVTAGAAEGPVGLCVPGLLDERREQVVCTANVPGLLDISLPNLLKEAGLKTASPPAVASDAFATAYDIYSRHALAGRLFSLAIGTGVGAAVLDDGKPLWVDGESPGHFGQIDCSIAGAPVIGPDGGAGSLEGYLGAAALEKTYGPRPAMELVRRGPSEPAIQALVRAVRIAHGLYRPHHVCLAGGTGIRLGPLLGEIESAIKAGLTQIARPGWTLLTGDNDFHAAAGAARLAARQHQLSSTS